MIKSYLLWLVVLVPWLDPVDAQAQEKSLMRRQTVGMAGVSGFVQARGQQSQLVLQSSTGQASPIGISGGGHFILRQGFIQPVQIGAKSDRRAHVQALVYPNPSSAVVFIELSIPGAFSLELLDPSGRLLRLENFSQRTKAQIDLSEFVSGLYLLRIKAAGQFFTERILKL